MLFLQDILENEDVKLDGMFKASLVGDIIQVCIKKSQQSKQHTREPI